MRLLSTLFHIKRGGFSLVDTIEQLISKVKATQKRLTALLEARAYDQDWQPEPGEWSFRYIAAHLATAEKEYYQDRVVRIAAGENLHFESYFNTGRDFSQFDLNDSLHAWTVTRQEITDFVHSLLEEKRRSLEHTPLLAL